jgi:hypothetical protein
MRRLCLGFLLVSAMLSSSGCAYSMVSRHELRTEPLERVLQQTTRARGIALEGPVDARLVSREELASVLEAALRSEWPEGDIREYQRSLNAIGLWPADRDLLREYLAVMGEEVAGMYVPVDKALYLVTDGKTPLWLRLFSALLRRDLMMEFTLSHELVHLLQHGAYPDLLDPDALYRDQDDLMAALHAAVEGDATLYGLEAMDLLSELPPPDEFGAETEAQLAAAAGEALAEAPALIRLTLGFPYSRGYRLAFEEGVHLLERPPASTEQVLHPGKRREPFLVFDLHDLKAALPDGCRLVWANTVGELGLSVLFRDLGERSSSSAWEGWDGDRYLVAECAGRPQFLWITAWDSEADAAEFESAYRDIAGALAARAGLDRAPEIERLGREVHITTDRFGSLRGTLASRVRRVRVSEVDELRDQIDALRGAPSDS